MTIRTILPVAVVCVCLPLAGFVCDVGVNPLLFDGSPVTAEFDINSGSTSWSDSKTLDLQSIVSDISKQIDSVKLINITVRVEKVGSMPAGATVSGTASFNGTPFLTLTNVAVDSFTTEQSIFKLPPGFALQNSGINQIIQALSSIGGNQESSSATLSITGTSSVAPDLKLFVNVYTQVFTPPSK